MTEITTKVEGEKAKSTVITQDDKVVIEAERIHYSGFNEEGETKRHKNFFEERIALLEGKVTSLEATVTSLHRELTNVRIEEKLDKVLHLLESQDLSTSNKSIEIGKLTDLPDEVLKRNKLGSR
ncbi:hypothetical protein ACWE42_25345 [Sutcliffiella cohnii]